MPESLWSTPLDVRWWASPQARRQYGSNRSSAGLGSYMLALPLDEGAAQLATGTDARPTGSRCSAANPLSGPARASMDFKLARHMKRVAAPIFVVFVVLVSSWITFAVGRKVATDRYRGSYCNDWITNALRDAKREGSVYKDARTSYNVEFSVFIQTLSTGVYFEGANYSLT